jgi:hypothetical protein
MAQKRTHPSGCSKSPSSKAAGESKPEAYPQGYVEDFGEPRTKLVGFFSILLTAKGLLGHSQLAFDDCTDGCQSLRGSGFKP